MQQESVNSLTEKHEMYCDCDAITKFSNNTCMSKYINNDHCCTCCTCSTCSNGGGGGSGANTDNKNTNDGGHGNKYKKTTKKSNSIASNEKCNTSDRFGSKSNQFLNVQRRRKRRRRSQWSSRWYSDFSKVLFIFVFCSHKLFMTVRCDRSDDNAIRTVFDRPVSGSSTWTTTSSNDGSSTLLTAENVHRSGKQSTENIDRPVFELNQYKSHKTITSQARSILDGFMSQQSSVVDPKQSQLLRSDAAGKSPLAQPVDIENKKNSNNINRKSSNGDYTNDLMIINNYDKINEQFKLPLERLMHILSSPQNYSDISSSKPVRNNNEIFSQHRPSKCKGRFCDRAHIKKIAKITQLHNIKHITNTNTNNNTNNNNTNNNYNTNNTNNNTSNSTIDNSSHKFDNKKLHLRITSNKINNNDSNESIHTNELIKVSNDLKKKKIEQHSGAAAAIASNEIHIRLSNRSNLRHIHEQAHEKDKAPEKKSNSFSTARETTCLDCIKNNQQDNPFDRNFLKKPPSSKVTPHTLESPSLSSLPPPPPPQPNIKSKATAINPLNISTSKNTPISIRLLQKMHQPKNKYPKTTSNIYRTTTKLMTNQKRSNNLFYVDENDVKSSAPTILDTGLLDNIGHADGSQTDNEERMLSRDISDEGNARGTLMKHRPNMENGEFVDHGKREYVPLMMEDAIDSDSRLNRTTRKYLSTSREYESAVTTAHANQTRREQLIQNIFSNYSISIKNYNSLNNNVLLNENNPNYPSESIDNYENNNNNNNKNNNNPHLERSENTVNNNVSTSKQLNDNNHRIRNKKKVSSASSNVPGNSRNDNRAIKHEHGMPEEDFRKLSNDQMRLESIKYQILTKLGLKRKPNITQTLPKHIIMSTLSRANEARIDTNVFRSHRSRYKTFDSYATEADDDDEQDIAHPLRGGEGIVNHIPNDGYDYYNDDRRQYYENPTNPAATPSRHNNNISSASIRPINERNSNLDHKPYNGNQQTATRRTNKIRYSRHRFGEDGDNYHDPNDEYFEGDQNDDFGSADDFYGRTREIIIFAEKGELIQ